MYYVHCVKVGGLLDQTMQINRVVSVAQFSTRGMYMYMYMYIYNNVPTPVHTCKCTIMYNYTMYYMYNVHNNTYV